MKKYIFVLMLVLLSTMVVGQPLENKMQIREGINKSFEEPALRNSTIHGLEKAQLHVENEYVARILEQNWNRIQERQRLTIQNMEKVRITNYEEIVVVEGETETKFLGLINAKRQVNLVIDENGVVSKVPRFWDFAFRYNQGIKEIPVLE